VGRKRYGYLDWSDNKTYFEVNKALVSRSRIFQQKTTQRKDLHCIVEQTLTDPERGYGKLAVQVEPDGLAHLVNVANGDARSFSTLLNWQ